MAMRHFMPDRSPWRVVWNIPDGTLPPNGSQETCEKWKQVSFPHSQYAVTCAEVSVTFTFSPRINS